MSEYQKNSHPEPATINGQSQVFGIIGHPVCHSLSPVMLNAAFQALQLNKVYVPLPAPDPVAALHGFKALGVQGASVTIPHKEAIIPHLDWIEPIALKIGAVNTLLRVDSPDQPTQLHGHNTDWIGSNAALAEHFSLRGSRALVLGAGGAAKAVALGLLEAGAEVIISNRTTATGQQLANRLGIDFLSMTQLADLKATLLINATSVGMTPHQDTIPIAEGHLKNFQGVMDIVYAPLETRLLKAAKQQGCQTIDGLAMLLYQGAAQFELWTGGKAPITIMRAALEQSLQRHMQEA